MKNRRPKGWGLFQVASAHDPLALIFARLDISHLARPLATSELRALWPRLEQAATKKKRIPCLVSRDPVHHSLRIIYLPAWLAVRHYPVPWLGVAALYPWDARAALMQALLDPERREQLIHCGTDRPAASRPTNKRRAARR